MLKLACSLFALFFSEVPMKPFKVLLIHFAFLPKELLFALLAVTEREYLITQTFHSLLRLFLALVEGLSFRAVLKPFTLRTSYERDDLEFVAP